MPNTKDIKNYIISRYKQTLSDLRLSKNDDEAFTCLAELARLTKLASDIYGFDFADGLRQLK